MTKEEKVKLQRIFDHYGISKELKTSDQWKKLIELLDLKISDSPSVNALEKPVAETFDFEKWYNDCPYATYFKEEKLVHCANPKAKFLPTNRKIDPRICDECWERRTWVQDKLSKEPSKTTPNLQRKTKDPSEIIYCPQEGRWLRVEKCDACPYKQKCGRYAP